MLEPHRAALESCVYCPKLSRAACPVSNVEHNEALTPWGKMSLAYFAARGDVPLDAEHAANAWACSACYACRERCDHHNDVASALLATRAEAFGAGVAPAAAHAIAARFPARAAEVALALAHAAPSPGALPASAPRLLVGCGYARHAPDIVRDAVAATTALVGEPVQLLTSCCGLPLLHAGDHDGFLAAARALAAEAAGASSVVVVDAGCARALSVDYERLGVVTPKVALFVDLAAEGASRLRTLDDLGPVRWHDPCQLGRGLGRYDEPRAILARVSGAPPLELQRSRGEAECSGGGGLLPATRPDSAAAMASARVAEHRRLGGGTLVTGCAQSLRRFRRAGEPAEDIVSLIARALVP
jgi:Fe-S oxidoreductase